MCGRFNLIDSPEVQWLCESLGIDLGQLTKRRDTAPGDRISIVHDHYGERTVSEAIWWLMLDSKTLKPNYKYASFNSRSDRLNESRSLAYRPFRSSRCIIPASAFVEGLGDKKTYHKIELEDSAIAFGGIFKEYISKETGERQLAASIITLPPLIPEFRKIHPKSMPLMLPFEDEELISRWLNPEFDNVQEFDSLLTERLESSLRVTRIDRPSKWNPIEDSFMIL
ncbi:MAG: putative SOS response-associated peptidase YoqW [Nitrospirales bacterium]|nr:MAG: putative SOS response-associated peptidase YoqW [Nitrospirales bacterium]